MLVPHAQALIIGPYSPDSFTLHLWHLNESATPVVDFALSGGTNFMVLTNGATLGNSSYPGFGTALSTYDGGPNGTNAADQDALLAARAPADGSGDDVLMTYADPATGAFTYEAIVQVDFDAGTLGVGPGLNGRTDPMQIISGENDGSGSRVFQFCLDPVGTENGNTVPMLEFINIGSPVQVFQAAIPLAGPDAIASNHWYHVAVTFNGNPGTANNLKLYWTLLDPSRTSANLIGSASMSADLPSGRMMDFCIGNEERSTPSGNFVGLLDEVRLSSIARAADAMLFAGDTITILSQPVTQAAGTGQPVSLSVSADSIHTLFYQWRLNGSPVTNATQSVYSLASAQFTNSGAYDVDITSSLSSVTSSVAILTVTDPVSATYLNCLLDFERYAESVWHDATYANSPASSGYFGDGNSGGNGGIRGSCSLALGYGVLVSAFPGDLPNPTRLDRISRALNYAANTHLSGPSTNVCVDGKRWGHDWQTALWAANMGLACVLVEGQLPSATAQACRRAVADEATYRAGIPPASGYVGDTKAEENSWDSNIPSLAAAWLSTSNNASLWLTSAKQYLVNSITVANTNGDPLAGWVTTVTAYPSFAIENHGFYHPSYQTDAANSLGDSFIMARLANPAVASNLQVFAEHNVLNLWGHLGHMLLDSSEYAYPSGLDWALHSYEQNNFYAWLMTHFNDPLARRADTQIAGLVRYRQQINGDGRFVGPSEPNGFYREAVEARSTSIAWLHHQYGLYADGPSAPPSPYVASFPDIGLICQRGPSGFVSVGYGDKIMGFIEPPAASLPDNPYVTTPRMPGLIGIGALGTPVSGQLLSLETNANGFEVHLVLNCGASGTNFVYLKSVGDAVAIVEVPQPTAYANPGSAPSFSIGIENHPLTGPSRLLAWKTGQSNILERSGVTLYMTNQWVCVSGRLGMIAGPAGQFHYQAASSYNRLGAAEDRLEFLPQNSLAPHYAVFLPGSSTNVTDSVASQVVWQVSGTNGVLTFPGADSTLHQMNVAVPLETVLPYTLAPAIVTASSYEAPNYPPSLTVDGNTATFWNSSGQLPGEGPTPEHPEWLNYTFNRNVGIVGLDLYPRVNYGPKTLQILVGTNVLYAGDMGNSLLSIRTNQPLVGTNVQLVFTAAFDPRYPNDPRSVQVAEAVFLERAVPGSFLDWQWSNFTSSEMADLSISGPGANPDGDPWSNAWEFICGLTPKQPDAGTLSPNAWLLDASHVILQFRERKDLGDVQRFFLSCTNLSTGFWMDATPQSIVNTSDLGQAWLQEATLPVSSSQEFWKIEYSFP